MTDDNGGGREPADKRIPVTEETRERVRLLKRGGERYDETINRMVDVYEAAARGEPVRAEEAARP